MIASSTSFCTTEARQQLFIVLYQQAFPAVARYVSRQGGSLEEAQDIFQDTLVIYYEQRVANRIPDNETAYLIGIARHLWSKKIRGQALEISLEEISGNWADETVEQPSQQKLLRFLTLAGQRCMDLLRTFYYDQVPLAEIADRLGYAGVRSATVQKYKCLEKVRNTIKEQSLAYEDFLEEN